MCSADNPHIEIEARIKDVSQLGFDAVMKSLRSNRGWSNAPSEERTCDLLRASGVLDAGLGGIRWLVEGIGWDTRFVDALPTAFVKPLSGSGSRAMMIETMNTFGVDSFPGLLAATFQGSTETTFYVLAVFFGAVGITRIRHGLGCALVADTAGITTAIVVCYWFFG